MHALHLCGGVLNPLQIVSRADSLFWRTGTFASLGGTAQGDFAEGIALPVGWGGI